MLLALVLLVFARGGVADPPLQDMQRRDFGSDCARSGCHAGLMNLRRLHGPVARNDCQVCHEQVGDPKNHRFEPTRSRETLCAQCHRLTPPGGASHVHQPFAAQECTACHNPHGGRTARFLKVDQPAMLCAPCHDVAVGRTTHAPVAQGDCLTCHDPHESKYDHLFRQPDEVVCLGCHRDLEKARKAAAHVHEPGVNGCTACHLGHGGDAQTLLRPDLDALCLNCHESVAAALADPASVHKITGQPRGCLTCHRPHHSDIAALLVKAVPELCSQCHDKSIEVSPTRTIPDLELQITMAVHRHRPVSEGRCDACHVPHGSRFDRLLVAPYPINDYADYDSSTYALCFRCHDLRLVAEPQSTQTGFRNGDRNLHYVHVHGRWGRTCTVCHESHAADLPKLMHQSIPFGSAGWVLPINFKQTASGGSCAPGCHQEKSYDNTMPVIQRYGTGASERRATGGAAGGK